jgi:hypothetical protein
MYGHMNNSIYFHLYLLSYLRIQFWSDSLLDSILSSIPMSFSIVALNLLHLNLLGLSFILNVITLVQWHFQLSSIWVFESTNWDIRVLHMRLGCLNRAKNMFPPLVDTLMFSLNEGKIDQHLMACPVKSEAAYKGYCKLTSQSYDVQ